MTRRPLGISLFALLLMVPCHPAFAGVKATFRHPLSNFSGPVRSHWARLAVDPERDEIYALDQRENDVRIFDEHGMEIHTFAEGFYDAADIAIGEDGDIFVLTRGYQTSALHLFDYRGEHVSEIEPKNIPAEFSESTADRLVYRQGALYLVNSESMIVIVLDADGFFKEAHDFRPTLRRYLADDERFKDETGQKRIEDIAMNGFHVDKHGNMFFTVAVVYTVYRFSPEGELVGFGRSGGAPGKFGLVAGVVTDDMGYIYVADKLKSAVLVFDQNFDFQTEFGFRGYEAYNLITPDDLAVDSRGNVYISQAANKGVSVFRVVYEAVRPPQGGGTPPTGSEKPSPTIEEIIHPPDRLEAAVDQRGDTVPRDSEKDATSTDSEESAPTVEETYLPDRSEFIVDEGDDLPATDSEQPHP
jgi:DNA-binding beta-propeller fold protein YncE